MKKKQNPSQTHPAFFKRQLGNILGLGATFGLGSGIIAGITISSLAPLAFPILPFVALLIGITVTAFLATIAISWIIGKFIDKYRNQAQAQPPVIIVAPQPDPEPKRLSSHAIVNDKTNATTWVAATDEPTPESEYASVPPELVSEYAPAPSLTPSNYAELFAEDPDFTCKPG